MATLVLLFSLIFICELHLVVGTAPVLSSALPDKSISESTSIGTSIHTVPASDADGDTMVYKVTTGNARFVMDGNVLKTSDTFDYETIADRSNTVTITVTDVNGESVSDTMIVSVIGANDEVPVFNPTVYTASIAEATGSGVSVKGLTCTDADGDTCTLSIQSGDDSTAKFSVSGQTIVTSSTAIDYESLSAQNFVYTLVVTAYDGVATGTATLYVTITAVNEYAPSISISPSTVSIAENVNIGTSVCTVVGTDSDTEPAGTLRYSIISGNTNGEFGLDATSGIIYTFKTLDHETSPLYTLVVRAVDAASSPRTGSRTFTVTITDVNDNAPSCSPNFAVVSLAEPSSAGATVYTISCSDADGVTPSYSIIGGNSDAIFTVTSTNVISIASGKSVDYDSGTTAYSLTVRVSDGAGTYSTTIIIAITITAVNEATPSYATNPTQSLAEDSALGTAIYTYTATDSDAAPHGIVSYAITAVTNSGSSYFTIDHSTGVIQLAKSLDYEANTVYELRVVATDGGGLTGTGTVTVSVTDVNDNTPSCASNLYAFTVPENTAINNNVIADLQCTDSDTGSNSALSYALTLNPGSKFAVSAAGAVSVSATLDYETTKTYYLQVTVSDGGSTIKSTVIDIYITVTNINEGSPVFTSSGLYSITYDENIATATTLVTVSASDSDTEDTITYGFTTTYSGFLIVPSSGTIILTRSLDYETADSHKLLVTASDGTVTTTGTVSLTVNNVNEAPAFGSSIYSPSLDENGAVAASVVQVSATDPESGTITYSIVNGDGSTYFTIDSSTGIISTSVSLNYEEKSEYHLVVRAADPGSPSLSATCLVNITVNDLNDNTPTISPLTLTLVIDEDTSTSTVIRTFSAVDSDSTADNNNVVEYTLTTNTIPFALGTSNGQLSINTALDRETVSSYELVLTAIDKGTLTQLSSTYTYTVILADVNDNTPVITGTYDTTISESSAINTLLFSVSASDIDAGDNARLTYSISSGDTNNDFTIVSGIIFTAKTLDRETISLYNLTVQVNDNGSPANTATITATVTISDINDNAPVFTSGAEFNVSEDLALNGGALTLTATDADIDINALLTYSIQSYWSSGSNPFTVDGSSGVITITSTLDRETLDTHNILVRVTDGGSPTLSSNLNITITLTDVNDNMPVFGSSSYSESVTEGAVIGTTILTVSATDADIDTNAVFSFSIDTAASGGTTADQYVTLDASSGVITLKQVVDRETISSFDFIVKAVDSGSPQLTGSTSINIAVGDINDNAPIFSPTFYDSEIAYSDTCSSYITTITATDADSGVNAAITYYILSVAGINFDDYFEIGSSTGELKLKSEATSGAKYLMTFGAHDSGSTQQSSSQSAQVRVDTYDPDLVVIVFYMDIALTTFTSTQSTFQAQLTTVYQLTYPTSQAKIWCSSIESTSSIRVHVYVVKDDTADASDETGNTKQFLIATTARDIVASSTGSPGSAITGSTWTAFAITNVLLYNETLNGTAESTTPWLETTTGIAVVSGASAGFLILLIIALVVMVRFCKKDNGRSSSKVNVAEADDEMVVTSKPSSRKTSKPVSGKSEEVVRSAMSYQQSILEEFDRDDLKSAVLYQDPAMSPRYQHTANTIRTQVHSSFKRTEKEPSEIRKVVPEPKTGYKVPPSPVVSVSPLPYKVDSNVFNNDAPRKVGIFNDGKKNVVATKRSQESHKPEDADTKEDPKVSVSSLPYKIDTSRFNFESVKKIGVLNLRNRNFDVKNKSKEGQKSETKDENTFDARAVDQASGRVYLYNTQTLERKWLDTTDQNDIVHQTKF